MSPLTNSEPNWSCLYLTPLGLGGGQYCPQTFERLSSKNYLSQWSITFLQFLNMYILWLQTKKLSFVPLPACWEGFQIGRLRNAVHILDIIIYFFYIYQILVTDFIFGIKNKFEALLSYFGAIFCHVLPVILNFAWARAGQRANYSKCLNEVYRAYLINHISYKKFLDNPNWFKIRQILGGEYCNPHPPA